jgi:hypothetical protein
MKILISKAQSIAKARLIWKMFIAASLALMELI